MYVGFIVWKGNVLDTEGKLLESQHEWKTPEQWWKGLGGSQHRHPGLWVVGTSGKHSHAQEHPAHQRLLAKVGCWLLSSAKAAVSLLGALASSCPVL